ncbi:MAG TPA: YceI family protein [Thermomicrobiales bacterium]
MTEATTATAAAASTKTTWVIDASHTEIGFAVRHMMISTAKGHFHGVTGTITLDEADLTQSSAEVTIDAATIDTRDPKRDEHLRSADFLDVEHYPTITFKSTKIESVGENRFKATGDLTIRGVTRPVVLDIELQGRTKSPWGQEVIGLRAEGKINRSDFGLNWNVALEAGGFLVGDEVKLIAEVEAILQS